LAENEHEGQLEVPIIWAGVEDVPILYANTFVSQIDSSSPEGFIITVGQVTPPALVGTPDQVREQAKQISYVPVRAVARIGVTRAKLEELVQVLQLNLEQFEEVTKMRKDPRSD
jgi:hypothetical protein